jgi:tetratricopeptide (TPR) repeat protein
VVNAPKTWTEKSERTPEGQTITDLRVPQELVDESFYLIHFTAGYSYYDQGNYKEALPHFEAALGRYGGTPDEIADLQFFSGFCNQALGTGQKDMTSKFQEAIGLYEKAAKTYEEADPKKWAETQNNLGCVYFVLPGDRAANLQKAIDAFQAALGVGPDKVLPVDRAMTQNNLGNAYAAAVTGDRAANLQRAIDAFQAALGVRTEKVFPVDWAMTQFNLGVAYADLPTGDRAANLQSAMACFKAALTIFTETTFRNDYRNAAKELAQVELQLRNLTSK